MVWRRPRLLSEQWVWSRPRSRKGGNGGPGSQWTGSLAWPCGTTEDEYLQNQARLSIIVSVCLAVLAFGVIVAS